MLKHALATAIFATGLTATPVTAAPEGVELGLLTCTSQGGMGMIIQSTKALDCTFDTTADGVPDERYVGTIEKIGIDIGETGDTVMQWAVLATDEDPYLPNSLAGQYRGVGAEATVAAGAGANVIIGGSGDSFMLQPVSVQTQEGLNVAIGITTITLVPAV